MSITFKVTQLNNFCRVFELPEKYPESFCFGGPIPTLMGMVDWFNPVYSPHGPFGELPDTVGYDWIQENTVPFLLKKPYVKPGRKYLVLFEFGAAVTFEGREE